MSSSGSEMYPLRTLHPTRTIPGRKTCRMGGPTQFSKVNEQPSCQQSAVLSEGAGGLQNLMERGTNPHPWANEPPPSQFVLPTGQISISKDNCVHGGNTLQQLMLDLVYSHSNSENEIVFSKSNVKLVGRRELKEKSWWMLSDKCKSINLPLCEKLSKFVVDQIEEYIITEDLRDDRASSESF